MHSAAVAVVCWLWRHDTVKPLISIRYPQPGEMRDKVDRLAEPPVLNTVCPDASSCWRRTTSAMFRAMPGPGRWAAPLQSMTRREALLPPGDPIPHGPVETVILNVQDFAGSREGTVLSRMQIGRCRTLIKMWKASTPDPHGIVNGIGMLFESGFRYFGITCA